MAKEATWCSWQEAYQIKWENILCSPKPLFFIPVNVKSILRKQVFIQSAYYFRIFIDEVFCGYIVYVGQIDRFTTLSSNEKLQMVEKS